MRYRKPREKKDDPYQIQRTYAKAKGSIFGKRPRHRHDLATNPERTRKSDRDLEQTVLGTNRDRSIFAIRMMVS
jgi:hypothetical protein